MTRRQTPFHQADLPLARPGGQGAGSPIPEPAPDSFHPNAALDRLAQGVRAYARRLDAATAIVGFAVILTAALWMLTALPGAPRPGEFVARSSAPDAGNLGASLP